ncbi:phage holin [Staphylococcus shinii]|uniref:phage holin n=1 Tax=Staphylococcus shinii TaxID=2912228 RepID=UPI00298F37C4|nr:phage holin [Staphylococcus shinii]MDW8564726.1 phage holin [Staphylococcus shinii]
MTVGTITRYIVLFLAIVNQILSDKGLSPIPVDEESINTIILAGVALYTTYKNNPNTKEGKEAHEQMKVEKAKKKLPKTGKAPVQSDKREGDI